MVKSTERRQTIYDLSQKLGIGVSTVSAVLNGTWVKRRISPATAELIFDRARQLNYVPNHHAKVLSKGSSGLVGLLIPNFDARLFAAVANAFELQVRGRNKFPIVISAGREPQREVETAEVLISYAIEGLIICGASDPDAIHKVCLKHNIPHVNIDLPGKKASSIISDNVRAGYCLAEAIVKSTRGHGRVADDIVYVGGLKNKASDDRIKGFESALDDAGVKSKSDRIHLIGYDVVKGRELFQKLFDKTGKLPGSIFIDGPPNYEALLGFLSQSRYPDFRNMVVGCFDLTSVASYSVLETWVIRQDAAAMVEQAVEYLYSSPAPAPVLTQVAPSLIPPARLG
ncbi:LacI family fructose operon transcriptional repressor [Neorhizobium galegae]|uniref:LacI family DNA-binding transcriptional regulator n=1 Tax=Neorhizobium galegae TaxID=399 RepID=UPI002789B7DF|nr:LacI family DNA-binding transcriptional regulator [Neorhizobium galegae]MDQ0138063.1 LacI family fructose operon transcriptional repressor [Neorhizobium galegae]